MVCFHRLLRHLRFQYDGSNLDRGLLVDFAILVDGKYVLQT
jgi:hypothetical protein